MNENLKIFLPSSGSLSKGSLDYFEKSELIISKESDRKLVGKINGSDSIEIYFQRFSGILYSMLLKSSWYRPKV